MQSDPYLPVDQIRVILVHAHPDDESINNGATMAALVDAGAKVTLVTCTRGEEGEILVPELAHLAATESDGLGVHRETELADAMKALGVADHRFLGGERRQYRDSGMMGTVPNKRSENFWNAPLEEAATDLMQVIVEVKPHILITYDEFGGYGHPDHIQAHRVAMRAITLAETRAENPWRVQKIYWNAMPKSIIKQGMEAMKESGSDFFGVQSVDEIPFAKDDELVTTVFDGTAVVEKKMRALEAHKTQISLDGPFFALSNNLGNQVMGYEYYTCIRGEINPVRDENNREVGITYGVEKV